MRSRAAHIALLLTVLTVLAVLAGCGRKGRVIPEKKMVRLYTEMFLADQWLRDNEDARDGVDTTLFFDPIFRRHGFSFEDYNRSVHFYLDRPEKYSKILNRAADRIRKEGARVEAEATREEERLREIRHLRSLYHHQDLSTDSLRWTGPKTLWPVFMEPKDTTAAVDSAATQDSVLAAKAAREELLSTWEEIKPVSNEERTLPRRIRIEDKPQQ